MEGFLTATIFLFLFLFEFPPCAKCGCQHCVCAAAQQWKHFALVIVLQMREMNRAKNSVSHLRSCFMINGQAGIWTWVTPRGSQASHFADKPIEIPRSLAHWLQILEPTPEEQPLPLVSSLSSASWYSHPRTCCPQPIHINPCLWVPPKHRWWFQTPSTLIANISALDPTISHMRPLSPLHEQNTSFPVSVFIHHFPDVGMPSSCRISRSKCYPSFRSITNATSLAKLVRSQSCVGSVAHTEG